MRSTRQDFPLSPAQRKGLIDTASPEAAALLRGLELSGARPKELAEATCADFDGERLKLSHRKGRPPKLRSRYVVLDADGVVFEAVLESGADGVTGKSALLRVHESLELEPGKRFRVLDAGIAADPDDAGQPLIVTLAMFSEIFAVA